MRLSLSQIKGIVKENLIIVLLNSNQCFILNLILKEFCMEISTSILTVTEENATKINCESQESVEPEKGKSIPKER